MGITGKRVEKSGIVGGASTMPGAGPTDLLYGSRGNPSPTANTTNPNRRKKGATLTRTQTHPANTPAKADGLTGTETQA